MQTLAYLAITASLLLAPADSPREKPSALDEGIRLQPGDALAKPIDPIRERDADDEQELDALAWFAVGRLYESRDEFREALSAYRKAIEIDPEQVAIYRRLVPLEFNLGENEQGIEHALKLVDLAPDDVDLMRQLSQVLISQGQIARATGLLEKALTVKSVKRLSAQYLALQRDLGVLYLATGNNEKAAEAFEILLDGLSNPQKYALSDQQRTALLADPETTYEQLGQTFLSAEKTDLAIKAFKSAAEARGDKPGILEFNLARVHRAAGKPEQALEQIETYIEKKRTERGRAAYDLFQEILTELDRKDEFVPRLREVIEQQPENHAAKLALADELFDQGELDEAASLYKAVTDAQTNATGLLGLARVDRERGRPDKILLRLSEATVAGASNEAISEELAAIARERSLTESILAAERAAAEESPPRTNFASALLAGKLAVQAEQIEDAQFFFRLATSIRPDKKATLLSELGIALMIAEKLPEAVAVLREALDSTSDDAERLNLMFRLAQAQEFNHETDAALKTIEEALEIAPEVPLLHFQRAWIHFHAEHFDKAEELFLKVIEEYPQDADVTKQARLALSALYVQQDNIERGEEVLEIIYNQNPDDPAVCNDLGYLYADQGKNLEQAEEMIRKAVASEPENAAYLDSLGWVLYKQGKHEEAAEHLEKAVEMPQGDDATLWDHLGDVYDKLNRPEDAKNAWQHALDLAREDEAADEELIKEIEGKLK